MRRLAGTATASTVGCRLARSKTIQPVGGEPSPPTNQTRKEPNSEPDGTYLQYGSIQPRTIGSIRKRKPRMENRYGRPGSVPQLGIVRGFKHSEHASYYGREAIDRMRAFHLGHAFRCLRADGSGAESGGSVPAERHSVRRDGFVPAGTALAGARSFKSNPLALNSGLGGFLCSRYFTL
jgi:hypothetical protein